MAARSRRSRAAVAASRLRPSASASMSWWRRASAGLHRRRRPRPPHAAAPCSSRCSARRSLTTGRHLITAGPPSIAEAAGNLMKCGSGAAASTLRVLGLRFEELRKTEVVTLELRIPHLAVAAKVDTIEAAAKSLDVSIRQLRGELREHRPPQLEPFVGEVAAMVVIVNHHQ